LSISVPYSTERNQVRQLRIQTWIIPELSQLYQVYPDIINPQEPIAEALPLALSNMNSNVQTRIRIFILFFHQYFLTT
jgi:hypothetical protein